MSIEVAAMPDESQVAMDLVRRIATGDAGAEAALVERYSRGLRTLLRRCGARPETVDDFFQETFRIVIERLRRGPLENPAALAGFLRATARNLVIADRRKAARRQTDGDEEVLQQAVHPGPSQLSAALLDEEAETVRRLIRELPTPRDRQLLLRYYVGDEDRESLCADLGLERAHFNRVLSRARQRFKETLERHAVRLG